MTEILDAVGRSPVYIGLLIFFALYPIVSSIVWISTATLFFLRRELNRAEDSGLGTYRPFVSVLIAAYNEEAHIEESIEACLGLDYPNFEVVVVDDGSTDATLERLSPFVRSGRVRLVRKMTNEGKAMALNDALPCLNSEIFVVIDADATPAPDLLRHMVPHFAAPRVAAVTGNPRVVNRRTLLSKLQVLEFTSIVSLLRRAQRIWGRILTMSGVVTALRRSAVLDAGGFSKDMATEDIDLTWKLQEKYYDVRYEPRAMVWMRVPSTLGALWRQRRRWALGLSQVLRRHGREVIKWKRRRMWPVFVEASLSILWAYTFVALTLLWIACFIVGVTPVGADPFPNWWGMTIASLCILQLVSGVLIDRKYDGSVTKYLPLAVIYPLVYWMLMAIVTAVTTPKGLFGRRPTVARWHTPRESPT